MVGGLQPVEAGPVRTPWLFRELEVSAEGGYSRVFSLTPPAPTGDGHSVESGVKLFDRCCSSPGPHIPPGLEPFSGGVVSSGGWTDEPRV